jgi:hypothetical protein
VVCLAGSSGHHQLTAGGEGDGRGLFEGELWLLIDPICDAVSPPIDPNRS